MSFDLSFDLDLSVDNLRMAEGINAAGFDILRLPVRVTAPGALLMVLRRLRVLLESPAAAASPSKDAFEVRRPEDFNESERAFFVRLTMSSSSSLSSCASSSAIMRMSSRRVP